MAGVIWNAEAMADQEWGGNFCDDLYVIETGILKSTTIGGDVFLEVDGRDHWWCLDPDGLGGPRAPEVLLRWPG